MEEAPQETETAEERAEARGRQTRNLMIAAAVLLILPLIAAAIVHFRDPNVTIDAAGGSNLLGFQRRFGEAPVATPIQNSAAAIPVQDSLSGGQSVSNAGSAVPQMPAQGQTGPAGSLGFITGGSDYAPQEQKPAAPEKTEAAPPPAAPPPMPALPLAQAPAAPPKAAPVPAKAQPFSMPKLQTGGKVGSGFGSMMQPQSGPGAKGAPPGMPAGMSGFGQPSGGLPGGMPSMGQMGTPTGGMPGGMPNMGQMMQGMPQGAMPGGMPNIGQMMQGMPQGQMPAGMPNMGQMLQMGQQAQGSGQQK